MSALVRFACTAVLAFLVISIAAAGERPHIGRPAGIAAYARSEAALFVERMPSAQEIAGRNTGAKYEPPIGCYLGGYIEFDRLIAHKFRDYDSVVRRDPSDFEERVGRQHAMYFFYVGYGKPVPLGYVRWLGAHGKFVHVALEPNDGLDRVRDDAYLEGLAAGLAATGAKIFLRFGSEMNGEWVNYHNAAKYRARFRLVYSVMHRRAPNVALVWCPYATPVGNIPAFYPGDDATDWVGVNMYSVVYHDNKLSSPCEKEHTSDLLAAVYHRYAARKPMMICEFGATHFSACDGKWRPEFAALKIGTLYESLPRMYPRVKAINYFDLSSDGVNNNYSVTDDGRVLEAYRRSTADPYYLSSPLDGSSWKPTEVPMPLRKGELLRGRVRLSCFARAPSDLVTVEYRLDGFRLYRATHPLDWPCIWEASSAKPGRHKLTLDVFDGKGRKAASRTVEVVTAPL